MESQVDQIRSRAVFVQRRFSDAGVLVTSAVLSAQKCDYRHCDDCDRQGIVPDALPPNRAVEFGIMGLQILNDCVHLAVDQSELLGQCRSEISWFRRLRGFAARLHSLASQLYCQLHPIHRR